MATKKAMLTARQMRFVDEYLKDLNATQASLSHGGDFTGGSLVEVIRVRTGSNQGNQRSSTVGARQSDERGLPAGSYIISLQPVGVDTDAATGVYSIEWEERP